MDVSLDTDITIHLYEAGKEELLFKYFDKLYMHEFILEREIKNKSITVYNRIKGEIEEGRIIKVTQRYLIELGMKTTFENLLYEIKVLFDYGEANAVALAAALGISALVTDDTKDFGPHETLVREYIENIMPFAFYELLYLEYLQSDDDFNEFENSYDEINNIAYSEHPMDFIKRVRRTVRRFSQRNGTKRDTEWMIKFCNMHEINYGSKVKVLLKHLVK
jgi:predicted nucleic acid-binding protein